MAASFVHLHLHTEFSLEDGIVRIKPLIARTAELGMGAVAITDMVNLFGLIKFYKTALSAGIKPIVGTEFWVRRGGDDAFRLVLLCQNERGYRHLTELITKSYQVRQKDRAVVDIDWLTEASEGLIALSAAGHGDVGRALLNGNEAKARQHLDQWLTLFPDRYYLEIQRTGRPGDEDHLQAALDLAEVTSTPVVASNDVRFLAEDDFEAHEARVCIQEGWTLADPRRPRNYSKHQYFKDPTAMAALFEDVPEALANSVEIAVRCNLELSLGKTALPAFPIPEGLSTEDYFVKQSKEGLDRRLQRLLDTDDVHNLKVAQRRQPYDERLERELQVILQMGFPGYFLIVADFIRWAKANGVPVGPGRGSGAGSLVAYALEITDLDPLSYDLLFERFLNPERVSMPDFDIDFCMEGRDRVIDYVARQYGRERVSQIATHGTMAAKAVVRDVGRVLGHPYGFVDSIAKLIPFHPGKLITLEQALQDEVDLKARYDDEEEVRALIDLARKLEGLSRNVGKHAGGVVIAPSRLTDYSPLYLEAGSETPVTQFDKDDVEAAGLVKFDFLGLRTLTIIDWAVANINAQGPGAKALDINRIPLDDPKAYELLKQCHTTAVFQLESQGMKELIRRLQPDCFDDIVALVALFRPGPLQSGMVDDFIDRKHGRAQVVYPHDDLAPILKPTYGVILYQEQVMQIAQVLANYTLGGADLLRRAMGKKKVEEMAKQRVIFTQGAQDRGVDGDLASYIFDLMEKFAGYGFNRSHSAAYALLSYQTAWLKAHYPAEFMAAVLSSDMDKTDKVVVFIEECRRMKLEVTPPSVNASDYKFTVGKAGRILYGLGAIKGVGEGAIANLLDERRQNGVFKGLLDLCRRIDMRRFNRRVLEAMIKSGAMDVFGHPRATLMAQLPEALKRAEQSSRTLAVGQWDLFGLDDDDEGDDILGGLCPEWEDDEKLRLEKETLGLYLTGHPISRVEAELPHLVSGRLGEVFNAPRSERRYERDRSATVAGLVVGLRTKNANKGGRMAFVTLDDRTARIDVRVFAEAFERHRHLLNLDQILVVKGNLSYDEYSEAWRLNADEVMDLDTARAARAKSLWLSMDSAWFERHGVDDLASALADFRDGGQCPVAVHYRRPDVHAQLWFDPQWRVSPKEVLLRRLQQLLGKDGVRIHYG